MKFKIFNFGAPSLLTLIVLHDFEKVIFYPESWLEENVCVGGGGFYVNTTSLQRWTVKEISN